MRLLVPTRNRRAAISAAALLIAVLLLAASGGAPNLTGAASAQSKAHTSQPYTYLKTRGTYRDTTVYGGRSWSVYQPQVVERWIAADGSGRQRQLSLVPQFVSAADRQAWEAAGKPVFLAHGFHTHVGDEYFPAGAFDERLFGSEMLSSMPADPGELAQWLQDQVESPSFGGAGNGFPDSVKTIELVTDLLGNPLATPAQRSALVKAEAMVPGVEDLGPARDEAGRSGVALGARSANSGLDTIYSLVFDPGTARILAGEQRLVAPPAGDEAGLVASTVYLSEGETRSRRVRPHRVQRNR